MKENRLLSFLLDDVKNLISCVDLREDLQSIRLEESQFETLGDFVNYWEHHIENINH